MSNPSNGGAFLPSADYTTTGNWTFAGTVSQPSASSGTAASSVTASETGVGFAHQTTLRFTALPVALSDTHVGGGTLIYTFPKGNITILGATATVTPTTTSAILTTLNGSKNLSTGVGSVQTTTQDSGTLVTTEQDLVNAFTTVSSATINVPGTVGHGYVSATTALRYDGTTSALVAYLNVGVPTAGDIDADATITCSGSVVLTWVYNGTY